MSKQETPEGACPPTNCSAIPVPGKYWMRNTDMLGNPQWRIVWVRLAMTSDKPECVELGREGPWSDGYIENILKPEEWIPILPPNAQSMNWNDSQILPPKEERVLIIDNCADGTDPRIVIARWEGDVDGGDPVMLLDEPRHSTAGLITHWMPLPSLPNAKADRSEP